MVLKIDRYVARLIFVPLMATLAISAMLLLLEKMLRLFDFVINEGGPVSVVWRMLGNLIPQYLSLGVPIGLLLGVLLAFRKLALSSELDIMRASGISLTRMLRVPMAYSVMLLVVTFWLVGFLQPITRYAYEGLQFELRSGALGANISVGEFSNLGRNLVLRVEESREQGQDLRGIFVHATTPGNDLTASAQRGTFLVTDDPNVILLRLVDGVLIHELVDRGDTRVLQFDVHDFPIPLPEIEAFRSRGGRELELTLPELWIQQGDQMQTAEFRAQAGANFHRRLVQLVVLLVIPFLGVALAVPPKRSSSALGIFVAIITLIIYNEISEFAERTESRGIVPPGALQWPSFILFSLLAIRLFRILAYVPGGQPLGALDAFIARRWAAVKRGWNRSAIRQLLHMRRLERA